MMENYILILPFFLQDICQDFGTDILKAANVAVANILTEANKQRAAGNRYWWKLHEVALLLLGHLSGEIIEAVDACKLDQRFFDLSGLFQNVVLEDAKLGGKNKYWIYLLLSTIHPSIYLLTSPLLQPTDQDLPFLQGRAFWFASKYAEILPSGIIQQFVGAAVNSLQDGHSIIVRAFAVKALRR